jgi:hypothetical protein
MQKQDLHKRNFFFTCFISVIGISLFLLPLIHAWMLYPLAIEGIITRYAALGGILPWSDAAAYYTGANHFLETGTLDYWNTRRPLNGILFAIRLWFTGGNFQAALIVQALLCGTTSLLVAHSVARIFGGISGIITFFILFLFASLFIPTTLSETLGLTLGCLAFVFLWQGMQTKKNAIFFTAGLMLVVGLNTRAGAFLILPLLIVWLGYHFRNRTHRQLFNWKMSTIFTLGLLCGLLFNLALIKLYHDPIDQGAMHGNFPLILYALVSGGETWTHAYTVFPDLASQPESELAKFLYAQSFEHFKTNPKLLFIGLGKSLSALIEKLFSLFPSTPPHSHILRFFNYLLETCILAFIGWRFIKLFHAYKNEISLIGIVLFGMFLSAAVIWTNGGPRVFAVTVPFLAVAIGIIVGTRSSQHTTKNRQPSKNHQEFFWELPVAYVFSYTLLILAIIGPLLIKSIQKTNVALSFSCAPNETIVITKNIAGAPYVNLTHNLEKFKNSIQNNAIENKNAFLKILEPHILKNTPTLGFIYDSHSNTGKYIVAPLNIFLNQDTWTGLCAITMPETQKTILQVKSVEKTK